MPSKDQDGCNENSTKRFGKYLRDIAMTAGVAAKSFASAAKAVAAAGSSMSAIAASLARNREEAMAVIRDATGRVEVTDQENGRREVLLDNLRSTPFQFDESVPSSPHQRPSQEGSLHLQALADPGVRGADAGRRWRESLHTAMREVANIGMSTDEVENAVSILANQTPRPTIRMIRFRKE